MEEKTEIYIRLFTPILSILLCIVSLSATTWAWYTDSVSTGVNSITTRANISETVLDSSKNPLQKENGLYVLEPGSYTLSFNNNGKAEYGYYALIDLEDYDDSFLSITGSILNLFVNRVYAQENDIIQGNVYIGKDISQPISIPINVDEKKVLKIQYVWGVKDQNTNNVVLEGQYASYNAPIDVSNGISTLVAEPATVTFNFINATTGEPLPYSTLGIETYGLSEETENQPQAATVVFEAYSDEIEISAPEGYLLQMDESYGETDNVESRVYKIKTDEDVVINVYCVELTQNNINENVVQDPLPEGEANVIDTKPSNIENNTDESELIDTGTSYDTDINESSSMPSTGGNDSENKITDSSTENTIESQTNLNDEVTDIDDSDTNEVGVPDIPEEETSSN